MQIFSLQLSPSWRDVFSPVDIRTVQAGAARARIFKLLRGPRIDSKESIPGPPMQPGGPVRQPYSYSVPSPHRLFKNSSSAGVYYTYREESHTFFTSVLPPSTLSYPSFPNLSLSLSSACVHCTACLSTLMKEGQWLLNNMTAKKRGSLQYIPLTMLLVMAKLRQFVIEHFHFLASFKKKTNVRFFFRDFKYKISIEPVRFASIL